MPWEPSTRGTRPTNTACHYGSCKELNKKLEHYILTSGGNRWFCEAHWRWACLFFSVVHDCTKCIRNYKAELYKDNRTLDSVKFNNKWYDLCIQHYRVLDKELCILFSDTGLTFLD